ncbi:MAG: tetratricopeptide repeat protein [Verrucomicrobia bacterium]|nr:tetratricopeptide repeat protein [Verrucomicrobiota bacterium]
MNPLANLRPPGVAPKAGLKAFRALGIDLGTTNSTLAQVRWSPLRPDEVEYAECVEIVQPTLSGDHTSVLVPSVVAHLQDRELIGEGARRTLTRSVELGLRPNATYLAEVKNEIGTGRIYPQARQGSRSPAEVSGQVLKFLRSQAKGAVARTVVSVPASFQIGQRNDTLLAAELGGLRLGPGDLIDEPVAAFIDFLARQGPAVLDGVEDETEALIVDFGGGTCDVAVFTIGRLKDGGLKVSPRAVSRYHRLGGADIDRAIVHEVLIPQLAAQNGRDGDDWDYEVRKEQLEPQLLATAEQLKVGMCDHLNHRLSLGETMAEAVEEAVRAYPGIQTLHLEDGTRLRFSEPTMTGDEFVEVMAPFVDQEHCQVKEDEYTLSCSVFAPVEDALDRAGLKASQIGFLLAVGGSSLNPLVIEALKSRFGEFLVHRFETALDMQVAVARGAAYHALLLELYGRGLFTPVASDRLSIQTDRGQHTLIEKGKPLPAKGRYVSGRGHRLVSQGGPVRISFWAGQGLCERPVFTGLTEDVEAGTPLALEYELDANQGFTFRVTPGDGEPFEGRVESPLHNVVNPGKDREAILEIERQVRAGLVPREHLPNTLIELAVLHGKVGMHDKAAHLLRRVVRQCPEIRATALCHLAAAYGRKGDAERQERTFLEAMLAGSPVAMFNLAALYSRKGRWSEAAELCRRYEAEEPNANATVLLARCLKALGDRKGADAALADAFRRYGKDLSALDEVSLSWFQSGAAMSGDSTRIRQAEDEARRRLKAGFGLRKEAPGLLPKLLPDAQEGPRV